MTLPPANDTAEMQRYLLGVPVGPNTKVHVGSSDHGAEFFGACRHCSFITRGEPTLEQTQEKCLKHEQDFHPQEPEKP